MHTENRAAKGPPRQAPEPWHDDARWRAVCERDPRADGRFWYSVATTGVYCHPSCAARGPRRENVAFHASPAAARAAGFRPCRRCHPDAPPAHARYAGAVEQACRLLVHGDEPMAIGAIAATVGLPSRELQRQFKRHVGVTPKQFAAGLRAERMRAELGRGEAVTTAVYAAGYGAPSRFYEQAERLLGMPPRAYARGGQGQTIRWDIGASWLGRVLVAATQRGICAVLLGEHRAALAADLAQRFPRATLEPAETGSDFSRWVTAVLAGIETPKAAEALPFDLIGTSFQQRVWRALQQIPPGATTTYGALADTIDRPGAARAVGRACGSNPVAVLIPCHRVLAADGSLGGYRWGTERKQALLARERDQIS